MLPPGAPAGGHGDVGRQAIDLVERLCALGPRAQHSDGLVRARRLVREVLADARVVPYRADGFEARDASGIVNLLGVVPGRERHLRPIVLATHYDGPPGSAGAGDNAAAVASILTLAPRLAAERLDRDVLVALFDGGDLSARPSLPHGAEVFLRSQLRHDVKAALFVDRIGHVVPADVGPPLLVIGVESEPRLGGVLASVASAQGCVAPVARRRLGAAVVADAFRAHETPYLWVTAGHASHHRGADDLPGRLNEATMCRTLDIVHELLHAVAHTRLPDPYADHDIDDLERRAWQPWNGDGRTDGMLDALRSTALRLGAGGHDRTPDA